MFSIAQTRSKSNCDAKQKFTNVNGESCAIAQTCMDCHSACDAGIHEVIANLRGFGRLKDQMAAEILSGSNEKALDILRTCGCNIFIPGTIWTTLNEFAKFYGVKKQYIQSIMNRWGVTQKKTPSDCTRGDFNYFAYHHGVLERYSISRRYQEYTLCDKLTHRQMKFSHAQNGNFYSARSVLAFAAMMYYGKNIHPDAVGNKVFETLRSSTYFDAAQTAMARQMDVNRNAEASDVDEQSADNPENTVVMSDDGRIILATEFFAEMLKTAVREAVSEIAQVLGKRNEPAHAVTKRTSNKFPPPRLSKPENWDAVVSSYDSGDITRRQAAELTGMCIASFDNYRTGKRQFPS